MPAPPLTVSPNEGSCSSSSSSTGPAPQAIPPPQRILPAQLLPILQCPYCPNRTLLNAPTTLYCGHTLCSEHLHRETPASPSPRQRRAHPASPPPTPATVSCPLPGCGSQSPAMRLIPSSSNVQYFPPIPQPGVSLSKPTRLLDTRVDVTLAKIIALVLRASIHTHIDSDEDDGDDDDEDNSSYEEDEVSDSDEAIEAMTEKQRRDKAEAAGISTHHSAGHVRHHRQNTGPPRKRPRKQVPKQPAPASETKLRAEVRFEKDLLAELTCEICFMLMYQPVTTPCQHTFCAKCLQRSLDHSVKCPLCRQDLPGFSFFQDHAPNKVVLSIIRKAFPEAYAERQHTIETEERDSRFDTPIFICQLSFPGMPTLLHFFEPRYRLMLRRCLESSTPRFGMVMAPRVPASTSTNGGTDGLSEFGTMLEIKSVQMLPDGRSMVETWGISRFRILERSNLDGYIVARTEPIEDFPPEIEAELERNAMAVISPRPPPYLHTPPVSSGSDDSLSSRSRSSSQESLHMSSDEQLDNSSSDDAMGGMAMPQPSQHRPARPQQLPTPSPPASSSSRPSSSSSSHRSLHHHPRHSSSASSSRSSTSPPPLSPSSSPSSSSNGPPPSAENPPPHSSDTPPPPYINSGPPNPNSIQNAVSTGLLSSTSEPTTEELMAICHEFLEQLKTGTAPWVVQRLNNTYGPMPTDPSSFSFWMALVLPIDEHEKAKLLPIRSARLRLRLVVHWIEQLNNNWWFSRGCIIV